MGSRASKSTIPSTTTTTLTYTTRQTTTVGSESTENLLGSCSCNAVILAFFSGVLVTLLILALIYCVVKVRKKVKRDPTVSPDRSKKVTPSNGPFRASDESITYATLSFKERKSMIHDLNEAKP